jgi:hypothetical protein
VHTKSILDTKGKAAMPTIMLVLNVVLIAGVVVGIVGLCAWGIVTDRSSATFVTNSNAAPARRGRTNRRARREAYRRPGRAIDVGA